MIIGITGNSGSGKTEFSKILFKEIVRDANNSFNENTVEIIDADKVVKKMSKEGLVYFDEIVKMFGEDILIKGNIK